MVVTIHVSPLTGVSSFWDFFLKQGLARLAVPLFFLAAGFFYARSYEKKGPGFSTFKTVFWRLASLYGIWTLIYLPLDLWELHTLWGWSGLKLVLGTIFRFLTIGTHVHFWYFPALIFSLLLVHIFLPRWKGKGMLGLGVLFYGVALLGDSYFKVGEGLPVSPLLRLIHNYFDSTKNLVFSGFLFTALGAWTYNRPPSTSLRSSWLLAGIFTALSIGEAFLTSSLGLALDHNTGVFLVPAGWFVFIAVLHTPMNLSLPYTVLRHLSVLVYCVHPLILFGLNLTGWPQPLVWGLVVAGSLAVGWLILQGPKKIFSRFY